MSPERLTSLDASFLYLERPTMHMHVAAISVLAPTPQGPLTYDDVLRVVESRLDLAPRLRQRVMTVPGNLARPLWIDDERFDLDFHLRRAAIPAPGGRFQLERAVGRVLSRQLDRSKPLWELYVFEGLAEGRTAVLLKLHHALADGISGMMVASALFDLAPDAPPGPPAKTRWRPEPPPDEHALVRDALRELVLHPMEAISDAAQAPTRALGDLVETLSGMKDVVGMGRPPEGPFDVPVSSARRFSMADRPFNQVRAIKETMGGSINDIVLCAVAGGLHDLLEARGEPTRGLDLRVMVPVSIRSRAEEGEVGNRVAPAFVDIPVGKMTPRSRLRRVRAATGALKQSAMAVGADSIIGLGAYAPPALHATAARMVSRGHWFNLVVSNIPAPQVPLYLGGALLEGTYPAMPLGENCALSVAVTSLAGRMSFGLTADWDAVRDLELLARGIERQLDELSALTSR